jgi:SAM-dependent methyltransferase
MPNSLSDVETGTKVMTSFEWAYVSLEPFMFGLYPKVRTTLKRFCKAIGSQPELLDVGGRKSHYTSGLPAQITISDVPRSSEIQERLYLGINDAIVSKTKSRRSNLREVILDDMTRSQLGDHSYDVICAVEVLEHVEEDDQFVAEVKRVVKPSGVFVMTTPNGDFIENTNPDHKRHYTRQSLHSLLSKRFKYVSVNYCVRTDLGYSFGLKSWSLKHPIRTIASMAGNFFNLIVERTWPVPDKSQGTAHLFAVATDDSKMAKLIPHYNQSRTTSAV